MDNPLRNYEALPRSKFNYPMFQINEEPSLNNVEEFIILIVFMPVVFPFENTQADYGAIHLAERLVEPLVCAHIGHCFLVNCLQRAIFDIETCFVRKILWGRSSVNSYTSSLGGEEGCCEVVPLLRWSIV
jgi:hypothetical protein